MAPPRLFGTTITRSAGSRCPFHSSAPASYRNERSPINATVGPVPAVATPSAVETRPSMPLAPRFASTWSPSRGAIATSRSRIGVEFPTNSVPPSGTAAARSRARRSSVGSSVASSTSSIARRARSSASCQDASHPSGAGSIRCVPSSRPVASRSGFGRQSPARLPLGVGVRVEQVDHEESLGGGHERLARARRRRGADLQHDLRPVALQERRRRDAATDRPRAPPTPAAGVPTWVPRAAAIRAAARAARPRSGPSTSSIRRRPRRARPTAPRAARSTSAASGSGLRSARSTRAGSRSGTSTTSPAGTSGSSNEQLMCTGPGCGPPHAATASRPIRRHSSASSADDGHRRRSRYARGYVPNSRTWSIVWFAPVPRSRGGRSAVSR